MIMFLDVVAKTNKQISRFLWLFSLQLASLRMEFNRIKAYFLTFRQRREHQVGNTRRSSTLSEDSHSLGVSAEVRDEFVDPLEGLHLVQKSSVARDVIRAQGEETFA